MTNNKIFWPALAITTLVYCFIVIQFATNLPFYDDITQIVWILNEFIDPKLDSAFVTVADTPDKLHALFYPNAGHIPLGTRLFALLQYYAGGVNFQISIWAANIGWLLTLFLLIRHSLNIGAPLWCLLPIPFLMLNITHWEAMSMALGGWQMYWGAALFPVITLIAVASGAPVLAAIAFFGALFESGGSLSLYPLILAFFLFQRQWKNCLVFAVLGGLQIGLFLHFNPISANLQTAAPDILRILKFTLAFFGNIFSVGLYDLQPLAFVHITTGILLMSVGIFCVLKVQGNALPKLIFIYVLLLALMAAYKRPDLWIVSRYSVFALLATSCIYLLFIQYIRHTFSLRITQIAVTLSFCLALGLWASSLHYCVKPLREDYSNRIQALQKFIATGDASNLMWNGPWASEILHEAKRLGVYDYEVGRAMNP